MAGVSVGVGVGVSITGVGDAFAEGEPAAGTLGFTRSGPELKRGVARIAPHTLAITEKCGLAKRGVAGAQVKLSGSGNARVGLLTLRYSLRLLDGSELMHTSNTA